VISFCWIKLVSTSASVIIPSSTKTRKNVGMVSVTVYRCTSAFTNSVLGIPLLYSFFTNNSYTSSICGFESRRVHGCLCVVLSGRGLCDELITRPEESYRIWCVVVSDLETWGVDRPWPALSLNAMGMGGDIIKHIILLRLQTHTQTMKYLLLFHGKSSYAKALQFYVYTWIACLVIQGYSKWLSGF
jgi:hypothetical protein